MSDQTLEVIYRIGAGAVALALLIGIVIEVLSILQAYALRPATLDPSRERVGEQPDPAWPNYFSEQVTTDYQTLLANQGKYFQRALHGWWTEFPFAIATVPIVLAAGLALVVFSIVFVICQVALTLVAGVSHWLVRSTVRLADFFYAKSKRSEASCPVCYYVMDRPAYVCPGCGALHRDIRAGKQGALFRRCACGHRLPVGVLRAAWKLDAVCQHCGAPVHRGAAVLQDVRVPVFGDPHAGKTRLIFAGVHSLLARARAAGLTVNFPDEQSRQRAEMGLEQITSGKRTIKTEWQLEPALTCQVGVGTAGALVHVFDAAGERFRGSKGHDDLRYLDEGHTLVFVVDPFAVPGLRDRLASGPQTDSLGEHLLQNGVRNPEGAYGEVVSRVHADGADTERQRLAVVLTKADVISEVGVTPPSDSTRLRTWLYDNGLHNVVLAADREFRESQYFAAASVDGGQADGAFDPSAPFVWALSTRGVKLPVTAGTTVKAVTA